MTLLAATAASGFVTPVIGEDGEPLRTVQLLPAGPIVAKDGRRWLLEDAAGVIASTLASLGSTQMFFDYDHQLVFGAKEGVGGRAPASGWVTALHARDDGIWADVEWTAAAQAQLKAREYRYLSPYFYHEKATGRITRLVNAALVNNPAITSLPAVASEQEADLNPQGTSMKFTEQLAQKLGLPATASEAQILEAVATQTTAAASATATATAALLGPVAKALGLAETAKPEEVTAAATAATAAKADPSKFAPMEVVTTLQAQVKALTDGQATSAAAAAVDAAIEDGKVAPALKDWALGYATTDLDGFKAFAAGAPKVVTPGKEAPRKGAAPDAEPVLTAELQAAARAIGVSNEDILATAKEETV